MSRWEFEYIGEGSYRSDQEIPKEIGLISFTDFDDRLKIVSNIQKSFKVDIKSIFP